MSADTVCVWTSTPGPTGAPEKAGAGVDPRESDVIQHIVSNIYSVVAVNVSFDQILQWKNIATKNKKKHFCVCFFSAEMFSRPDCLHLICSLLPPADLSEP